VSPFLLGTKKGGQHLLAGEWGANSDDWKESLALCLLRASFPSTIIYSCFQVFVKQGWQLIVSEIKNILSNIKILVQMIYPPSSVKAQPFD
jgi:hypothetical protein